MDVCGVLGVERAILRGWKIVDSGRMCRGCLEKFGTLRSEVLRIVIEINVLYRSAICSTLAKVQRIRVNNLFTESVYAIGNYNSI